MIWSHDALLQKAKIYAAKAMGEDRNSPWFPFWSTLILEFVGRAAVAYVHPVLLADPQEGGNLLYAFGYGTVTNPKSVPAKTVFLRCQKIVSDFTEEEVEFALALVNRRNGELHSGDPAFHDFPTNVWLAQYFRLIKILLASQKLTLEDLFGREESNAADKMIAALEEKVLTEVKDQISKYAKAFGALKEEVQDALRKESSSKAKRAALKNGKITKCPACGADAVIHGEIILTSAPTVGADAIIEEIILLPTQFRCYSCGLDLAGHARLHAAGLGGQFGITISSDPVEYYGIDPADYLDLGEYVKISDLEGMDYDYGND